MRMYPADTRPDGGMTFSQAQAHTHTQIEGHAIHANANPKKRNRSEMEDDFDSSEPETRANTASQKRGLSVPKDFCNPTKCKKVFKYEVWYKKHGLKHHSDILGGDDPNCLVELVCNICRENQKDTFSYSTKEGYLIHEFWEHYPHKSTAKGPSATSPAAFGSPRQDSGQVFSPTLGPGPLHITSTEDSSYPPVYQRTSSFSASTSAYSGGQRMPMQTPTAFDYPTNSGSPQPNGVLPPTANTSQFTESHQQAPHQTPGHTSSFASSSIPQSFMGTQGSTHMNAQFGLGYPQPRYVQNNTSLGFPQSQMMTDSSLSMDGRLPPTYPSTATPSTGQTYYMTPQNHGT